MPKKYTPMVPPWVCPCGFTTDRRRHKHFHLTEPVCSHQKQRLADRVAKEQQEANDAQQREHEWAVQQRTDWVEHVMDVSSNVNGEYQCKATMLGAIYDLIMEN